MLRYFKHEKAVTQVLLEVLSTVISVFEEFLLLSRASSPVVHILYDCICETLTKQWEDLYSAKEMDSKHGSSLAIINCLRCVRFS